MKSPRVEMESGPPRPSMLSKPSPPWIWSAPAPPISRSSPEPPYRTALSAVSFRTVSSRSPRSTSRRAFFTRPHITVSDVRTQQPGPAATGALASRKSAEPPTTVIVTSLRSRVPPDTRSTPASAETVAAGAEPGKPPYQDAEHAEGSSDPGGSRSAAPVARSPGRQLTPDGRAGHDAVGQRKLHAF